MADQVHLQRVRGVSTPIAHRFAPSSCSVGTPSVKPRSAAGASGEGSFFLWTFVLSIEPPGKENPAKFAAEDAREDV